jgi:hypothetical protein
MPDLMIWKQILVIYWKKTGLLHILLQEITNGVISLPLAQQKSSQSFSALQALLF